VRKLHQRQILDFLLVIEEAEQAKDYASCQEGALSVCDFIESLTSGGTQTVALLEEYCELLFKANNGEIGKTALRKHFIEIESSVKEELKPNKIEIAFISHKASMSDSLETIYLAAKEDPACDAYWIPVPYYEHNADGSRGEMHFEGAEYYSDEFDIVDWESYDLEARRPDAIFTFNAYDEHNAISSIHPDFYSRRLHDVTDMLVYVPYFVAVDDVAESFCTLPACVFADKVIVQSEKVRDTYIRVYSGKYGADFAKFGKPEEKFIALGSPKLDKVSNPNHDSYDIPEDWRSLIGNRKVVLYNTSIYQIMKNGEQNIKKICEVLDIFSKRNDVVLWWRPHPLSEATYQTSNIKYYEAYQSVVTEYRRRGWGIYDDSPDIHRAIALSDAYYGDPGSVVALYKDLGKPTMLSDVDILRKDMHFPPFTPSQCQYIHNGSIFIIPRDINALFKISASDFSMSLVGSFPDEDVISIDSVQYYSIAENNETLYFAPYNANEIALYSLKNEAFQKIPFINQEKINMCFLGAISYNEYVFFTPYFYPAIARLNINTRELDYYSDWVNDPLLKLAPDEKKSFCSFPIVVDNTIFLSSSYANAVIAFNMDECTSTVYEVGKKGYLYNGICFDGENFWLAPRNNKTHVIKWNPRIGVIKEFNEIYSGDALQGNSRCRPFCYDGFVWFMPFFAKNVIKISVHTDEVIISDEFNEYFPKNSYSEPTVKFWHVQLSDNTLYLVKSDGVTLVEYNLETRAKREKAFRYSLEQEIVLNKGVPVGLLTETSCMNLNTHLNHIANKLSDPLKHPSESLGTAGQSVFDYTKRILA